MLEREMRETHGGGRNPVDVGNVNEETIVVVEDRWWPQAANQGRDKVVTDLCVVYGRNVMGTNVPEVSLLVVEAVLCFARNAW